MPLDIVDYLAGFLWDDRLALQAFSHTCRSWRVVIRPYLYAKVTLSSVERMEQFSALLQDIPALQFWVRELCLKETSTGTGGCGSAAVTNANPWMFLDDGCDFSPLGALTNVHTVELHSVHRYSWNFHQPFSSALLQAIPRTRSLGLVNCTLPRIITLAIIYTPADLRDLHLHDLCVWQSSFFESHQLERPPLIHQPCLYSLRIHGRNNGQGLPQFLQWLTPTKSMQTLRSVEIQIEHQIDLMHLGPFLASLDSSIQHLDLQQPWLHKSKPAQAYKEIVQHLDLKPLQLLHTVHLCDIRHKGVLHLLSQLSSPHLRTIVFHVSHSRFKDTRNAEEILLGPNLANVQGFHFLYSGKSHSGPDLTRRIKSSFPSTSSRVPLHVRKDDHSCSRFVLP